jgi:glycosyltransferase involved in cell wall biosynthesis
MTSVTIVVPVYNQAEDLAARLVSFADYFAPYRAAYGISFVIVDDASTNGTLLACRRFAQYRGNVTIIPLDRHRGVGHALRTAFRQVAAEYTIVLDGALSFGPNAALELLEALERTGADIALASPYMAGAYAAPTSYLRDMRHRLLNRALSLLSRARYATFTCIVRAYRTACLRSLPFSDDSYGAVPQLLFSAIHARKAIVEIPARIEWKSDYSAPAH